MTLKNKVVLITGASSGIGEAIAREFSYRQALVILIARREEKLKEITKEINAAQGRCFYIVSDITKKEEVEKIFYEVEKKYRKIDILINNAGIGLKKKIDEIEYEEWKKVIDLNLNSVFLFCSKAIQNMKKNEVKGTILTVSSLAGKINIPGYSGYCCSKHAVSSLMQCIKWEVIKHNISVSTIHPYKVQTEFFKTYLKQPSRKQMLLPKDIAVYLVALAEKNYLKVMYYQVSNFIKRIIYLIKK